MVWLESGTLLQDPCCLEGSSASLVKQLCQRKSTQPFSAGSEHGIACGKHSRRFTLQEKIKSN